MRKILILSLVAIMSFAQVQEKKITKTGVVSFEASVPSFEEIKAKNSGVTCVLQTETGNLQALALMKGFKFKVALMEEHFNENYVESTKYPKAVFKGKLDGFNESKLTTAAKDFTLKGKLELHGKTKDIVTIAKIKKIGSDIEIKTNFSVNVSDFGIEIPSLVSKKVSKKVNLDCVFLVK